jgi:hypothetical protein
MFGHHLSGHPQTYDKKSILSVWLAMYVIALCFHKHFRIVLHF